MTFDFFVYLCAQIEKNNCKSIEFKQNEGISDRRHSEHCSHWSC